MPALLSLRVLQREANKCLASCCTIDWYSWSTFNNAFVKLGFYRALRPAAVVDLPYASYAHPLKPQSARNPNLASRVLDFVHELMLVGDVPSRVGVADLELCSGHRTTIWSMPTQARARSFAGARENTETD